MVSVTAFKTPLIKDHINLLGAYCELEAGHMHRKKRKKKKTEATYNMTRELHLLASWSLQHFIRET